jgi:hypothetical protein
VSSTRKSRSSSKALVRNTDFGPPPILPGEDAGAYEAMLAQVTKAVKPTCIIEQFWIRDIVDLTWEIIRLRGLKARLISDKVPDLLAVRLGSHVPQHSGVAAQKLVRKWVAGDPDAKARVEKRLTSMNLTIDSVYGEALLKDFDSIERIDQLIMVIERRRNAVCREIDRHRIACSRTLRDNVDEIKDAEFKEIEGETGSPKIAVEEAAA